MFWMYLLAVIIGQAGSMKVLATKTIQVFLTYAPFSETYVSSSVSYRLL